MENLNFGIILSLVVTAIILILIAVWSFKCKSIVRGVLELIFLPFVWYVYTECIHILFNSDGYQDKFEVLPIVIFNNIYIVIVLLLITVYNLVRNIQYTKAKKLNEKI